jgi:hypothetical protein
MTTEMDVIAWAAAALLGLVAAAYVFAALLPPAIRSHQRRSMLARADRSYVRDGRVFCRVHRVDVDVDSCVGCPHLRVMDGRGSFIVCDGPAVASVPIDR